MLRSSTLTDIAPKRDDREYLDQLLNEQQAAALLGYSPRALQGWRFKGGGPRFVKVSRRSIRYRRRDLLLWTESLLRKNSSEAAA